MDFILDLTGYTSDKPLHKLKLLEPSFGDGDFLFPAIDRLSASWNATGKTTPPGNTGRLHPRGRIAPRHVQSHACGPRRPADGCRDRRSRGGRRLLTAGWCRATSSADLPGSIRCCDRQPALRPPGTDPRALLAEYRAATRRSTTAPISTSPSSSAPAPACQGRRLGFICADRWMKNRYGGPLRALVARNFT